MTIAGTGDVLLPPFLLQLYSLSSPKLSAMMGLETSPSYYCCIADSLGQESECIARRRNRALQMDGRPF
ncbi:hypothetical protein XELAEV_18037214mg [Xenopus laevis]|uniref:Uncharacterized protein n=1 Tax=Xenopus laevis TaxID=8355 RepID=A0A974H9Y2_XENLA|nr:hypothetical protein XELAEV_18037214mg [Xenopus laevis]